MGRLESIRNSYHVFLDRGVFNYWIVCGIFVSQTRCMDRILLFGYFMLVAFGLTSVASAQTSTFDGIADSLDDRPQDMYFHGHGLYEMGKADRDCDEISLGGALMLRGIIGGAVGALPVWDTLGCTETGIHWAEEMAHWHFINGAYPESRQWYRRALAQATSDRSRAKFLVNIGWTYQVEDQIDSAYFVSKSALDYGVENLSTINIITIAGLSLALRQPNTALEWGKLAGNRLASELAEGLPLEEHDRRRDLIHLSAMMAHLDMKSLDAAKQEYTKMKMQSVFPGMELEFVHAAMILALRTDDPDVVNLHKHQFEQWLNQDSAGAVARLGPTVMYFEPWRSEWMDVSRQKQGEVWDDISSLPDKMLPTLNPEEVNDSDNAMLAGVIQAVAFVFLLVTAVLASLATLGFALLASREEQSTQALEQSMEQTFRDPNLMGRILGSMSRIALRRRLVASRDAEEWLRSLSHREMDILYSILRNERPKETAELLRISTKTVYAFRSVLRSKFGLHRDESLEQWVHSKLKT